MKYAFRTKEDIIKIVINRTGKSNLRDGDIRINYKDEFSVIIECKVDYGSVYSSRIFLKERLLKNSGADLWTIMFFNDDSEKWEIITMPKDVLYELAKKREYVDLAAFDLKGEQGYFIEKFDLLDFKKSFRYKKGLIEKIVEEINYKKQNRIN